MNIFVVSEDQKKCAMALDDLRLRKMVLESAQMLCTAIIQHGGFSPYKAAHPKHPCTIWTAHSRENFEWHLRLLQTLHDEYIFRFEKPHKSYLDCFQLLRRQVELLPSNGMTAFVNATPRKNIPDVFLAYRLTLSDKWNNDKKEPTWKNRQKPEWA
jgi:hypothetical protein